MPHRIVQRPQDWPCWQLKKGRKKAKLLEKEEKKRKREEEAAKTAQDKAKMLEEQRRMVVILLETQGFLPASFNLASSIITNTVLIQFIKDPN